MIRWAQDELGVTRELNLLANVFKDRYGFNVETWQIPANEKSQNNLMQKALDFLSDYDSSENLFILYYAGHGFINQDRQSTWACSSWDPSSPTVDWSHIQGLFERAKSDVLVLLDCCAAASSAPRRGDALMETIAACGFEGRAPPPGEHSFTTSLIEVLEDFINVPSFSITMLYSGVLNVLKGRRKEKCWNGQKLEWRSTLVYINDCTHPMTIGIMLCRRSLIDIESLPSRPRQPPQPIEDLLQSTTHLKSTKYLDLMSLSCDGLEERLRKVYIGRERSVDSSSGPPSTNSGPAEAPPRLKVPHMLISVALDEDQQLPNEDAYRRWLCAIPAFAKHVKVEGVFASYSTVLILSIPVVIWNMLPENPACQPITYVTSRNLVGEGFNPDQDFRPGLAESSSPSPSPASTEGTLYSNSNFDEGANNRAAPLDLPDLSSPLSLRNRLAQGHRVLEATNSRIIYHEPPSEIMPMDALDKRDCRGIPDPSTITDHYVRLNRSAATKDVSFYPSRDSLLTFRQPCEASTRCNDSFVRKKISILSMLRGLNKRRLKELYTTYLVQKNVEKGPFQVPNDGFKNARAEDFPQGFSQSAGSVDFEETPSIYRRFGQSHSRLLMHLQFDIIQLERKLDDLDCSASAIAAANGRHGKEKYNSDRNFVQTLLTQLVKKVTQYYTILLSHHKLKQLGCAPSEDYPGWGIETQTGSIFQLEDFISLSTISKVEEFLNSFLKKLYLIVHPDPNNVRGRYYKSRSSSIAKLLTVLIAMGILLLPIVFLFWVHLTRFWMSVTVFGFVLLFSTIMSICTEAKVKDVLIGTAAYGAVIITFLGNLNHIERLDC